MQEPTPQPANKQRHQVLRAAYTLMLIELSNLYEEVRQQEEDDIREIYESENAKQLEGLHAAKYRKRIEKAIKGHLSVYDGVAHRIKDAKELIKGTYSQETFKLITDAGPLVTSLAAMSVTGRLSKEPYRLIQIIELYNSGFFDTLFEEIEKQKQNANELREPDSGDNSGGDNTGRETGGTPEEGVSREEQRDEPEADISFIESAGDFGAVGHPDTENHPAHETEWNDSGFGSIE